MIYLHKLLPTLFSPYGIGLLLIIYYAVRKRSFVLLLTVVMLMLFSLPITSKFLAQNNERDYAIKAVSDVKNADIALVLSGQIIRIKRDNKVYYEFSGAIDRLFAGVELAKANPKMKLMFTGGKLPWTIGEPEGVILANFARRYGVPSSQIVILGEAKNTAEEAQLVKQWMKDKERDVVLVTSAFHMKRAVSIFQSNDLSIIPYPVDFVGSSGKMHVLDFIPTAGALSQSTSAIREQQGRLFYKLKGLIYR